MSILLRWFLSALTLFLVALLVPGFHVAGLYAAFIAALILGLINAIIRPVLLILTLPINVLTLGLFTFVINALMLLLASSIVKGFDVDGFGPALVGALVITLISWAAGSLLKGSEMKRA